MLRKREQQEDTEGEEWGEGGGLEVRGAVTEVSLLGLGLPRTVGKSGVQQVSWSGEASWEGGAKGAAPSGAETVTFSAGGPLAPAGMRGKARFIVASAFQRSCFVFYFIFSKTRLISS